MSAAAPDAVDPAPRPLRLVWVAHNVVRGDGQGRVNLEVVRHALAVGHDVRVVAADADEDLVRRGARLTRIQVPRRPVLAKVVQFARQADRALDHLLAGEAADLIVGNGFVTHRPHGLSLCHFVHSAWLRLADPPGDGGGLLRWAYQQGFTRFNARQERAVYAKVRRIVTPSRITAVDLATLGVPPAKVSVIPNGVDLDEFQPGPPDRAAVGLPAGVPLVLFAGDLQTNRKGLRFVLDAVRRLPGVHLAVVGRADRSPFPAEAAAMGIADRVSFLGFRRDVPAVMRACDVFVLPSRYEPYGMVVSEALACGLPVVTSAATGASEIVDARCGTVLSDPADVAALARAITAWTAGRQDRAAVAVDCRRAAADHGWQDMARRYLAVIAEVATPASPPGGPLA